MFKIVGMLNRIAPRLMWIVGVVYTLLFVFLTSARWPLLRLTVMAFMVLIPVFLLFWIALTIAVRRRPDRPELWKSMAQSEATWTSSKAVDRAFTLGTAVFGVTAYGFLGAGWPLLVVSLGVKLVPGFFLVS